MPEVKDYLKLFAEQDKNKLSGVQQSSEPVSPREEVLKAQEALKTIRNNIEYYTDLIKKDLFEDPFKYGDLFGAAFSKTVNEAVKAILMQHHKDLLESEIHQLAIIGKHTNY